MAMSDSFDSVLVLTSKAPASFRNATTRLTRRIAEKTNLKVKRKSVLRDRDGMVRGYLPYLSFDIPLFFRLLSVPKPKLFVCEPPPTTGVVTRAAAFIKRVPYVAYASDIVSDAMEAQGASRIVTAAVRWLDKLTFGGANAIISVSPEVQERLRELVGRDSTVIRFGVSADIPPQEASKLPLAWSPHITKEDCVFLYAGNVAKWMGAEIFVEAMPYVWEELPNAKLVFLGQGSSWTELKQSIAELDDSRIQTYDAVTPEEAAEWMAESTACLASMVPGPYELAYTTKVLSSLAAGTPVVYAGPGVATQDIERDELGVVASREAQDVAKAMIEVATRVAKNDPAFSASRLYGWVSEHRSSRAAARRAVEIFSRVSR